MQTGPPTLIPPAPPRPVPAPQWAAPPRDATPRSGRTVLLVAAGLATLVAVGLTALDFVAFGAEGLADDYAGALLVGLAASTVPVAVIRFLDRRSRKPLWLYALAFGWGGIVATAYAGLVNTVVDLLLARVSEDAVVIGVPLAGPVEEPLKALGVLLVFWLLRAHFQNARDGLVIGALVGLGFNWLETAGYVVMGDGTGMLAWAAQFGGRFALLGLGAHTLWTALFGMTLGLTRQVSRRRLTRWAPALGLVVAATAHALSNGVLVLIGNSSTDPEMLDGLVVVAVGTDGLGQFLASWTFGAGYQLLFLPVWLLAGVLAARGGMWQRTVLRTELAAEIGGALSRAEYDDVVRDHALGVRRLPGLGRRRSARVVAAQNALAFARYRVQAAGGDVARDPELARLRARVVAARAGSATPTDHRPLLSPALVGARPPAWALPAGAPPWLPPAPRVPAPRLPVGS